MEIYEITKAEWEKVEMIDEAKSQRIKNLEDTVKMLQDENDRLNKADDLLFTYESDYLKMAQRVKDAEAQTAKVEKQKKTDETTMRAILGKLNEMTQLAEQNGLVNRKVRVSSQELDVTV